jgi:FAD/FMN-containing dehydrogenase
VNFTTLPLKRSLHEPARRFPERGSAPDPSRASFRWSAVDPGLQHRCQLLPADSQVRGRGEAALEVVALTKLAGVHRVPVTFRAAGTRLSGQAISGSVLIVPGDNWNGW